MMRHSHYEVRPLLPACLMFCLVLKACRVQGRRSVGDVIWPFKQSQYSSAQGSGRHASFHLRQAEAQQWEQKMATKA
jgi:hypothetical protein